MQVQGEVIPMRRRKMSVTLKDELVGKLKVEAKKDRRSLSQLIEIWLEDALAVQRSPRNGRRPPRTEEISV